MYVGNDTVRTVKKGYIGDATGKARLFYSVSYQWNRYNAIESNEYVRSYQDVSSEMNIHPDTVVVGGLPYLAFALKDPSEIDISTGYFSNNGFNWTTDPRTLETGDWIALFGILSKTNELYRMSSGFGYITVSGNRLWHCTIDRAVTIISQTVYSKGTYIDTVESDVETMYPTNGRHTDGYWYEKIS